MKNFFKKDSYSLLQKKVLTISHSFSRVQWIICFGSILGIGITILILFVKINNHFLITVPKEGGTFTEGIVGIPRFINPVLAVSDADKDISMLVYSGLMRLDQNGTAIPDLAESYTVSKDGLVYTVVLKKNIFFHDGEKVTSNDVLYTIGQVQNPTIKSPKESMWEGISVEVKDESTLVFTLKQRYPRFLENLTIGILPSHLFKDLSSEEFSLSTYNTQPVGSGPYKIENRKETSSGLPDIYTLGAFKKYALGKPKIDTIKLQFFSNEKNVVDAFNSNTIDAVAALSPQSLDDIKISKKVLHTPLPRLFGIFFNTKEAPIFLDHDMIHVIDLVIDRSDIITKTLNGYGAGISEPVPSLETGIKKEKNIEEAEALLSKKGWARNDSGIWEKKDKKSSTTFSFTLATSDAPELKQASQLLVDELKSFGINVELQVYEVGTLNQSIISPRKYQALFFGQILNHETDLYAFWHSSQRIAPGLNITNYTNPKIDSLTERINDTLDETIRNQSVAQFRNELIKDMPVVYVYSPDFIYVVKSNFSGVVLPKINTPSDRFQTIYTWYIHTENIWKFLYSNK